MLAPDAFPLSVLNGVLNSFGGTLFDTLRTQEGLCYRCGLNRRVGPWAEGCCWMIRQRAVARVGWSLVRADVAAARCRQARIIRGRLRHVRRAHRACLLLAS